MSTHAAPYPVLDWIPAEYRSATRVVVVIEVDLSEDDVSEDLEKNWRRIY